MRRQTRRLGLMFVLAGLIFLGIGCSPEGETSTERETRKDDLDREVTWQVPLERTVSLAPSVTELVFAAGAGNRLVGVTTVDDHPPAVDTIPQFSALPLDFEKIASLDPKMALATNQVNAERDAETLGNLGVPTYFISTPELDDVLRVIRDFGEIFGTEDIANARADSLAREIEQLEEQNETVPERPRVLFLIGDETLNAFGADSHIHRLIELAGGESITADLQSSAPVLSEEYVIDEAPDVMIGGFGAGYDTEQLKELHPSWDVVPAVENDRLYSIDGDIVYRPGPRLVEGAKEMARMLHPDHFSFEGHNAP